MTGARRDLAVRLTVILGAVPLLVTRPCPLQDWPNHVARGHILLALLHGDPFWTRFYQLTGFLIPNAVLDLGLLGLSWTGLGAQTAAQLFLVVTYGVFIGGFCALAHALGAGGPGKAAVAVLLFYGNALFWGLVSYILAVGLMLGLLALWIGSAGHLGRRLLIAGAGAAVLLFTHAVVAMVWPLVLGGFDVCHLRARRGPWARALLECCSAVLALVVAAVLLLILPGGAGHQFSIGYAGRGWDGWAGHKLAAFDHVLLGGSLAQDAASLGALLVAIAVVRRPRLDAGPSVVVAGLSLLTLAAPERLGTGSQLDTRLALLPLLMLAAAIRCETGQPALRLLTAAVIGRTLVVAASWHSAGLVFRDFRRQAAPLPPGGLMVMAYGTRLPSLSWREIWSPPVTSIATQLVFRDLFVPAIFSNPAEQPIALRTPYRWLAQPLNLSDGAHLRAAIGSVAPLCVPGAYPGVYLTVLYPGAFIAAQAGAALLSARADFLIVDACRLRSAMAGR